MFVYLEFFCASSGYPTLSLSLPPCLRRFLPSRKQKGKKERDIFTPLIISRLKRKVDRGGTGVAQASKLREFE